MQPDERCKRIPDRSSGQALLYWMLVPANGVGNEAAEHDTPAEVNAMKQVWYPWIGMLF